MIPASFDYERAESVDHAVDLLAQHGSEAKVLAGGHSLVPLMKLRLATPSVIIDVGRLRELAYARDDGDEIAIGALTTHRQVAGDPVLTSGCGLLSRVASTIGDVQVRARGTIGGSVAHGDPAADLPAALVALDATIVARGPSGERRIGASDFFRSFLTTALDDGELLTEIRVPKLTGHGWHYEKFVKRSSDWAIVGCAAVIERADGKVASARVALCNMGSAPVRAAAVEAALAGASIADVQLADAAEHAADETEPPADLNATPEYRRHLARVLTRRALQGALGAFSTQ
jgi:carbon-monoxide dehydrogenase medium subunit